MTEDYLKNIMPDSISGLIFAFEGIRDTAVLLNGPTGCKFYHSATSDNQVMRKFEYDPLNYPEELYFGQPRVPCTYLDKRDYVYGSEDKVKEALS
ncbi:MAG: oxidoreductase, partial [Lachnospiraceae bacterium]|nr:oxidoreductase [Lachnospiraceae bacterium]